MWLRGRKADSEAVKKAKQAARSKLKQEELKSITVDPTYLRMFEDKFNSETCASSPRGSFLAGSHIGNGCRWLRARRYN